MNAFNNRKSAARLLATLSIASLCALAQAAAPAKPANKKYVPPKTEFGQPDLRGVWSFNSDTPLERPPEFKNREFLTREEIVERRKQADDREKWLAYKAGGTGGFDQYWLEATPQGTDQRTSLIVDPPDGRLPPLQPGMQYDPGDLEQDVPGTRPVRYRTSGIAKDGPEDRGLAERCLMATNSGPPFMPRAYNNNVQIFQSKNTVVIMTEMIHEARVVPLDGRPPLDPSLVQWSGDSRGHWEGDTLVVDTRNFTDKVQSFHNTGTGKTYHLIERFTRTGPNSVEYRFTVDDLATFTKPITAVLPLIRTQGDLYEYACHEGNYGLPNILAGAREAERQAARKK